ncbi:MAG: hypothetical protein MUO26_08600 [Methanotrichaceae archaeon]|nr:hypothetical protein [Methanotrichaceae archaeon]
MPKDPKQESISLELSGPTASMTLTQGAINIWFGRSVDKSLISNILYIISRIDASAQHEQEVVCNFHQISAFEGSGYILISYAKKQDTYRAIFMVPFSDTKALEKLIESISEKTEKSEVKMTIYWGGGRISMNILRDELCKLNCFR